MNVRTVEIKGVKWFTDSTGLVKPVLHLQKPVRMKTIEFDGVTTTPDTISSKALCQGSKVKIKVVQDKVSLLDLKVKQSKVGQPLENSIHKCPTCGADVVDYVCTNDLCSSKALAQIYQLFKCLNPSDDLTEFKTYLANFKETQSGDAYHISSLPHLAFIIKNVLLHTAGSTGRVECYSSPLHEKYEKQIVESFKNGLPNNFFWKMLNFRGVSDEQLQKLTGIDYRLLATDTKAFDTQLHAAFTEDFESTNLVRDILHSERGLIRLVKLMEEIRNGSNQG